MNLTQPTDRHQHRRDQQQHQLTVEGRFARSKWLLECARQQSRAGGSKDGTGGSKDGSLVLALVYAEEARKLLDSIRKEPGNT